MKKRLYVPLMNENITAENRSVYAEMLKACGADFVFIATARENLFVNDGQVFSHLAENIRYFENSGFECGVWVQAFGFGAAARNHLVPRDKYTKIKSVTGNVAIDAFCPECERYTADYLAFIRRIAQAGIKMIMLDDDLCLAARPGIGCFCDHHIRLMEQELGETLAGKDLPALFFTGKPNRYRTAWLKANRTSLLSFAAKARKQINEIDPAIRMGFCAGYTSWDMEGADAIELTKTLAGDTVPFLRFTGAPYWVPRNRFAGLRLGAVNELARLQEKWCRDTGIEVFAEADSYPRPRYKIPASFIECFDGAVTASGGMGDLKYLFEYYAQPSNEPGYVKHHIRNQPLYDYLHRHFDGKTACGVQIAERMHRFGDADLPDRFAGEKRLKEYALSPAAAMMSALGIPTVYDENPEIAVAFNNNVKAFEKLPKKVITDLKGAELLKESGIDVGFVTAKAAASPYFECFGKNLVPVGDSGEYYDCALRENARVLSSFEGAAGYFPAAYTYDNGECEFLVLTFDAYTVLYDSPLFISYGRQNQLMDFIGNRYCYIKNEPGIYQICKRNQQETALFFENLCEDALFDFDISLDRAYSGVDLFGAEGELRGDALHITSSVAPYAMFAVVLKS